MVKLPVKKSAAKKAVAKKAAAKKSSAKKAPSSPRALARELFGMIESQLGPGELIPPSDIEALIASLTGPSVHDGLEDAEAEKKDEAQQIAFDAMEAETKAEARKLAKLLGDSAAVTAMLDRLLHHGHVLKCGPRSWRTKTGGTGDGQ